MQIKELILFTQDIQRQKSFYQKVLGMKQLVDSKQEIAFEVGASVLTFRYRRDAKPNHIAFNIPSNRIEQATSWLAQKSLAIQTNDHAITTFSDWNAQAVYFYDPDANIMEFIARADLNSNDTNEFTAESILSISEIGIATESIESTYKMIQKMRPIPIFDGDLDRFCALGDNQGLFILIDKTQKKWYPTNDHAYTSDFIVRGDYNFGFEDGIVKQLS